MAKPSKIVEFLQGLNPFHTINQKLDKIMAKLSELGATLDPIVAQLTDVSTTLGNVGTQLDKARAEIIAAITANDPEVPQAVLDKVNALSTLSAGLANASAALKATSQSLDDLNPDAPTP